MWTVTTLEIGRLKVAIGRNPRGWPFVLVVAWMRRGRAPLVLCDLGAR